ncbi:tRNA-specific 2-thiouridylase [Desulfovibrio sp. OttesenSCG-928-F20]|nr:tRNA-specific 2-thiouridylase [Desulfovibrio sp. OttesenSCG-928-M16]MDL2291106.1 tRNA-specific 2-thiouridylase [Desulfovibrio sp. OttesenSCG-928-F20]
MDTGLHVAVAVSGGADSLATLLLLKERGASPLALHGIFFSHADPKKEAEATDMRERLALVCRNLDVPLHFIDVRADFERLVIRPFVQAYAEARTPNPCALCNASVKFGLLREAALNLGAHKLATGHYAALLPSTDDGPPALYQGADPSRDQSYFLSLVPGAALAEALFPLAEAPKSEVLAHLEACGLALPQPGESREVCFIDTDNYQETLPILAAKMGIPLPGPGPMLLTDNTHLGTHRGLWRHTEGQRRGLGLGWKEALHVLAKEREGNVLRLGPRREMCARGCLCGAVNVLVDEKKWPEIVLVKSRYRERPKEARAHIETGFDKAPRLCIRFVNPDSALAPGQVAALYAPGELGPHRLRLLAGGLVESVE